MNEETYTFDQARARLEDIVSQVRKKDTALEASLDLLEEGVRLANLCTEQIDHTQWREATGEEETPATSDDAGSPPTTVEAPGSTAEAETDAEEDDTAGTSADDDGTTAGSDEHSSYAPEPPDEATEDA